MYCHHRLTDLILQRIIIIIQRKHKDFDIFFIILPRPRSDECAGGGPVCGVDLYQWARLLPRVDRPGRGRQLGDVRELQCRQMSYISFSAFHREILSGVYEKMLTCSTFFPFFVIEEKMSNRNFEKLTFFPFFATK